MYEEYISRRQAEINACRCKNEILATLKTIDKTNLARLCSFINTGLYEFVVYGMQVNNITYFELKQEVKNRLIRINP